MMETQIRLIQNTIKNLAALLPARAGLPPRHIHFRPAQAA